MPYNPQIQDQRAAITMQGLEMGQRSAAMMTNLLMNYLGQQREKESARAQIETLADQGGTDAPAAAAGPIQDPKPSGMITAAGGEPEQDPAMQQAARKGTQADAIRSLVKSYAPEAKDLHQSLKAMSLGQLEGLLKGYTMKAAAQEQAAKMRDLDAQAKMREQEASSDAAAGGFLKNYFNAPGVTPEAEGGVLPEEQAGGLGGPARPPTHDERWAYASANTPGLGGRVLPKVMQALDNYQKIMESSQGDTPKPYTSPSGNKYVQLRHILIKDNPTDTEMPDSLPGYDPVPDGKGGFKYLKTQQKGPSKLPVAAANQLTTSAADIADAQEKLAMTDDELKQTDPLKRDGPTVRSVLSRKLSSARNTAKTVIDTHQQLGFYGPEQRDALYEQYGIAGKASAPPQAKASPQANTLPTVRTQADFDALAPGAPYLTKDGRMAHKPK